MSVFVISVSILRHFVSTIEVVYITGRHTPVYEYRAVMQLKYLSLGFSVWATTNALSSHHMEYFA